MRPTLVIALELPAASAVVMGDLACPVCGVELGGYGEQQRNAHVEGHFTGDSDHGAGFGTGGGGSGAQAQHDADLELAIALSLQVHCELHSAGRDCHCSQKTDRLTARGTDWQQQEDHAPGADKNGRRCGDCGLMVDVADWQSHLAAHALHEEEVRANMTMTCTTNVSFGKHVTDTRCPFEWVTNDRAIVRSTYRPIHSRLLLSPCTLHLGQLAKQTACQWIDGEAMPNRDVDF